MTKYKPGFYRHAQRYATQECRHACYGWRHCFFYAVRATVTRELAARLNEGAAHGDVVSGKVLRDRVRNKETDRNLKSHNDVLNPKQSIIKFIYALSVDKPNQSTKTIPPFTRKPEYPQGSTITCVMPW